MPINLERVFKQLDVMEADVLKIECFGPMQIVERNIQLRFIQRMKRLLLEEEEYSEYKSSLKKG